MISRLRGTLLEIDGSYAVVEAGGVGYEVSVPESVAHALPPIGTETILLIRHVIREDSQALYGFLEAYERRMFDLLLEVKGCGPRIAQALLGQLGADATAGAIAAQDVRALSRANGVGPRLAERIIVELKEKVGQEQFLRRVTGAATKQAPATRSSELVDALLALGYRRSEAEAAARDAQTGADSVEEQLKLALRSLRP